MIVTPWNFQKLESHSEQGGGIIITGPALTYSIKELLLLYTRGQPLPKLSNHFFSGDLDLPELRKLDLTEQAELRAKALSDYQKESRTYREKREYITQQAAAKIAAEKKQAAQDAADLVLAQQKSGT